MAYRAREDLAEDRLHDLFLVSLVVLVLFAWLGGLAYLAVSFL